MTAFERLAQALDDLWEAIKLAVETPVRWLVDRPILIIGFAVFVIILVATDLLR